ncbi:hypothetical protein GCM10028856_12230 [Halopiger thermotolerans]
MTAPVSRLLLAFRRGLLEPVRCRSADILEPLTPFDAVGSAAASDEETVNAAWIVSKTFTAGTWSHTP